MPLAVQTKHLFRPGLRLGNLPNQLTQLLQINKMGALLSIPIAGSLGSIATSVLAGCAFCFTSSAGEEHPLVYFLVIHLISPFSFISVQIMQLQLVHRYMCRFLSTMFQFLVPEALPKPPIRPSLIFALDSSVSWLLRQPWAIKQIEKISAGYIQVDCGRRKVPRSTRSASCLFPFYLICNSFPTGTENTKTKRATIQNR